MAGGNPHGESAPIHRGGSAASTFVRGPQASYAFCLACWVATLAFACYSALRMAPPLTADAQRVLRVALDALPAVATLAFACYCWVRFHTGREVTWMFASLGFIAGSTLTLGHMAAVAVVHESSDGGRLAEDTILTISRLAPGVLLASAAFSTARVPVGRARVVAARCLITALLCAALALFAIARLELATAHIPPVLASHPLAQASALWNSQLQSVLASFHVTGLFGAAAAFALAIIGYWRHATRQDNRIAALISYWLATMGIATLLDAIAAQEGGEVWLASGAAAGLGAVLLILWGGVEFGLAYRVSYNRTTELAAVHAATSALAGARDLKQISESVVAAIGQTLQARLVALFVAKDENTLSLASAYGLDDEHDLVGKEYPLVSEAKSGFHTGNTARAFREQAVIVIPEAITACDFVPWRVAARLQGYVVCAPLVRHGKCLGVLDLLFPMELSHLARHKRLFEMIAGAVAPAVEAFLGSAHYHRADEEFSEAA